MRPVPDWWIQALWWVSGIFATGAVWYFLSTLEYCLAIAAGVTAIIFAALAVVLHRKKDALQSNIVSSSQSPVERDRLATSQWWEASDLRREYVSRGLSRFYWSNAERTGECKQQGYEVVYLDDFAANIRYRIVNKSDQILMAKRDA